MHLCMCVLVRACVCGVFMDEERISYWKFYVQLMLRCSFFCGIDECSHGTVISVGRLVFSWQEKCCRPHVSLSLPFSLTTYIPPPSPYSHNFGAEASETYQSPRRDGRIAFVKLSDFDTNQCLLSTWPSFSKLQNISISRKLLSADKCLPFKAPGLSQMGSAKSFSDGCVAQPVLSGAVSVRWSMPTPLQWLSITLVKLVCGLLLSASRLVFK